MKKTLLILVATTLSVQIAYAGFYSEKDIGTCIKKNSEGWCIESRTHYCSDDGNAYTGKCELWLKKGEDPFKNIMGQFNSFNEDFYKGVSDTKSNNHSIDTEKTNFFVDFPIAKKVQDTLTEYEKIYNEMLRKQNLGLSYDEAKFEIVESKVNILRNLYQSDGSGEYTNPYVTGYSALTVTGIERRYQLLKDKLNQKEISLEEFNQLKNKLVIDANSLEKTYNTVVNSNGKVLYAGDNPSQRVIEVSDSNKNIESKVQKLNNGFNNGVNVLNNTMNNVRTIKGFFGY